MPAQPKPPNQRRRRNAGQSQWKELPAEGRNGAAPELPDLDWLDDTRDWWETIWASPMATVWQPADVDPLIRLARLRDADARGDGSVSALAQITALEDRFGLSPKARRALQWEISAAESGGAQTQPTKRRLRAVG
jgi:hypothetical protein